MKSRKMVRNSGESGPVREKSPAWIRKELS